MASFRIVLSRMASLRIVLSRVVLSGTMLSGTIVLASLVPGCFEANTVVGDEHLGDEVYLRTGVQLLDEEEITGDDE